MNTIRVRNVHEALPEGLRYLYHNGKTEESRNGNVLVSPVPVTTVYSRPMERVIFHELRDANPFFHLMESLWMINGSNDVHFPAHFAANMINYSDDGETLNGAYGHRWRQHFGYDQLQVIVEQLRNDHSTRRAVLGMWDAGIDTLTPDSKDLPCNTHIYFRIIEGALDITVCCRSNDVIWGAYGANAVHFSFLQEFIASLVGVEVGTMYQISNNYHAYEALYKKHVSLIDETRNMIPKYNPYDHVSPFPLMKGCVPEQWQQDLSIFMENPCAIGFQTKFFTKVAIPIRVAWELHKEGDTRGAIDSMSDCVAEDWFKACTEWLERRIN